MYIKKLFFCGLLAALPLSESITPLSKAHAANHKGAYAAVVMNAVLKDGLSINKPTADPLHILLAIDAKGGLEQCTVVQSSRFADMDLAACAMAQEAAPFPQPPQGKAAEVYIALWTQQEKPQAAATFAQVAPTPAPAPEAETTTPEETKESPAATQKEEASKPLQAKVVEETSAPQPSAQESASVAAAPVAKEPTSQKTGEKNSSSSETLQPLPTANSAQSYEGVDYSQPKLSPAMQRAQREAAKVQPKVQASTQPKPAAKPEPSLSAPKQVPSAQTPSAQAPSVQTPGAATSNLGLPKKLGQYDHLGSELVGTSLPPASADDLAEPTQKTTPSAPAQQTKPSTRVPQSEAQKPETQKKEAQKKEERRLQARVIDGEDGEEGEDGYGDGKDADMTTPEPAAQPYAAGKQPFIQDNRKGQVMDHNDYYINSVIRKARALVNFPLGMPAGIVSTSINAHVTAQGKITKVEISRPSRNAALDAALVQATKQVKGLPPHPSGEAQTLYLIFTVETPE